MILAALALISMPGVAEPASQASSSSKGVTIEHVAGKVYMISGAGGNIGALITNDGILLVDSGKAGTGDAVLEALRTVSDKPVVQIVNTHWHPDHSGGNQSFGSTVTVVAHSRQHTRTARGGTVRGQTIPPATGRRLNAVTFNDTTTRIYLEDELVELQLIPKAHSGGDLLVTFHKSGVVQTGDLLFASKLPYADYEDGGSIGGLTGSLKAIHGKVSKRLRVIPGHGPVCDVSAMDESVKMLMETGTVVRMGPRMGRTVDDLMNDPAIKKYAGWAWEMVSLRQYVEMIYSEAPAQRKPAKPGFQPEEPPVKPSKP